MDKYKELIKDVADLISDARRENFLLSVELDEVKAQLSAAEARIKALHELGGGEAVKEDA